MKKGALLLIAIIFTSSLGFSEVIKEFSLGSPVFDPNTSIPEKYTCVGADISPALFWENVPKDTKSFVLVIDDPDAQDGTWVHWVLFNIPPETRNLTEGEVPVGAINGKNSWGFTGYKGPCPPPGDIHNYIFRLYALDTVLPLDASAIKENVIDAIQYHVLGMAEFKGNFQRE
ncbi:YbhB/YbcL family Raf kinase inhibitor-like protein [Legionella cardiaca]|uniref:YbhB/YbcL family Raf kinase inhibitor-like protein n=1 Tax=Legionella cardiaca TaxID=1071983 RepID=A0ABY8AS04_9GAMM|nr:YbhB/YbcL family Raf kinase inhibitor-like protein [Legionella cardiaca]WED43460.1 YbhB/YbcL family Raf kinase inhibitor-like protein [Legionella cardiaca]